MNNLDRYEAYEAYGPVRGPCGHRHRSIYRAWECAEKDMVRVRKGNPGAHSDREVCRTDGRPLDLSEQEELWRLEEIAMEGGRR